MAAQQSATAPGLPDNWHVGISTELKYISSTPPDAGGENYNGPERPAAVWAELKQDVGVTFSSDASFFTLLKLEYKSPESPALTIERLYFNIRNAFGLQALDLRLGRDAITWGPLACSSTSGSTRRTGGTASRCGCPTSDRCACICLRSGPWKIAQLPDG